MLKSQKLPIYRDWKNGMMETRIIPTFQHSIKMHKNHLLEWTHTKPLSNILK